MKSKPEILLIGGGGHCKSVIEAIESEGKYSIAGIVDAPEKAGQTVLGYPVIGSDKDLPTFLAKIPTVLLTVGQLKSAAVRIKLFEQLKALGAVFPVIIAASAIVSKHAKVGAGSVIMHKAVVNAGADIGENAIINTAAVIEHDAKIGNHCHVSTGAFVNGDCKIGNEVLIGSCSFIRQGIQIADKAIIGAGAVVLKNVREDTAVVGNPAKELKKK